MMLECCEYPTRHHEAIFRKYSEKKFKEAALVVQHALDAGFQLPAGPAHTRRSHTQPPLDFSSEQIWPTVGKDVLMPQGQYA